MPPTPAGAARATVRSDGMELTNAGQSPQHDWTISMSAKFLSRIKEKQIEMCKKEKAIRNLESHVNRNTIPKSLKITVKIQVSTEHQEAMDEIVSNATKKWEKTVIEGLLETRRDELETIGCQQSDVMRQWKECLNMTHAQMLAEGLLSQEQSTSMINTQTTEFNKAAQSLIQSIRSKAFFERKEQEEKKAQLECRRAERDLDIDLQDPAVAALQLKIQQLENKVKQLPKKDNAKPNNKKSGGGTNRNNGRSNKPLNKATKNKRRDTRSKDKGRGNPKPQRHSKLSTRQ